MASSASLPFELILRIIESLVPRTAVAVPLNSPEAQSIRACMLVCRASYSTALRSLYNHCLYIDSSNRLRRLLICLNKHLSIPPASDLQAENDTLPIVPKPQATLPEVNILPCLQNLYLSPFAPDSIDDLPTAQWIFELFSITRHTLRRLITAIPLQTLPPWQDHLSVRSWLRKGFNELTNVEEFVCLCDDLDLTLYEEALAPSQQVEIPIWAKWTKLRRLSFRKFDLARPRYKHLQDLPCLESFAMVVTLHPSSQPTWNAVFDRFTKDRQHDVQLIWAAVCQDYIFNRASGRYGYHLSRVAWANAWNEQSQGASKIQFRAVAIDPNYAPDEQEQHLLHLQTWMTERAVEGSLWDVSASARYRQSEEDPDLWIDESLGATGWVPDWEPNEWDEKMAPMLRT